MTLGLLVLTLGHWYGEKTETTQRLQQDFERSSAQVAASIPHRIAHLENLIRGVQGLHKALPAMGPQEFARYVRAQNLEHALPGMQGVSLIARQVGGPGGTEQARIVALETLEQRSTGALGFDVLSNPVSALALRRSTASAGLSLSARLQPVQQLQDAQAAAYVLYAPLYAQGLQPQTLAARQAQVTGWVGVLFQVPALMAELSKQWPQDVQVEIFDSATPTDANLVYRSTATPAAPNGLAVQTRTVNMDGQTWTVRTQALPAFAARVPPDDRSVITLVGVLAALLIGALGWQLSRSRHAAMDQAQQATQELQSANNNLTAILEAVPDLMFDLDLEGRYYQYWSPRSDLLAAPPELFIGKTVREVLPADAAAICMEALHECNAKGYSNGHEVALQVGDQTLWFELAAARKQSGTGLPRFIMLSREITPRKRAEQARADHAQQLTLALEGGDLGYWDWNFSSGTLQANARWYTMLGLDPAAEQASMDLWYSLVHPADQPKLEALVQTVLLPPEGVNFGVEIRVRHASGHYIWILDKGAVFSRDAQGRPVRVVGTHMEITGRKLDEEKLRLSDHAFKTITQGIIVTNPQGEIVLVNDAFCNISGYSREETMGRNCRFLQGPRTSAQTVARIRQALQGQQIFSGEILNYRKNGQPFWNDLEIAPVFGADNAITHLVGITKDITEKKAADLIIEQDRAAIQSNQQQLRILSRRVLEAQETERKRLAHELHDELGQSLTAVKINLLMQQAQSGHAPTPIDTENVRIVEDTLQQVRRLALALRPSMLDDLGLAPALAWLAKSASVNRDVVVDFQAHTDQARLPSEVETACFRIVQESLTNVRRHAQAKQVEIRLSVQARLLHLSIRDDGVGFDTAALAGAQSPPSLGVLGMRERAVAMGASLDIRSSPGQGCTVELRCTLPETPSPTP